LGVLDRRDKDAISLLFAAIPGKRSSKTNHKGNQESGLSNIPAKQSFAIC
jgi:hypothetical protein